ncbi:MAG: tetratricopeptide repeat protein [Desulfuromonadaceae bacterium]|nr:tetratricopeptide repeat protein [Desulfuromonadaceae bacterium]
MKYIHTPISRFATLFALLFFCCGFSWGLGKSDPCKEAHSTLDTLATITDSTKRTKMEESILNACPNGAAALFIKARNAENASKPDYAITLYREALAKDNTLSEAHGNLGLLLSERGLKDEASVELTKGLMGRSDPRYHRAIAKILNNGTLPSLALFHYDEALKSFPNDVELHAGRAAAYVQLGQYDKAEQEFVLLKSLQPKEVKYQQGLADVYRRSGRLDLAIKELQASLLDNSSNKEGHRLLAEALMEKGEREAARKEYLLAGVDVTINPEDFASKGDGFMKVHEFGQAISAYQTALKGRPAWLDVQYKLGKAQMSAGRDDDAIATLTSLIKAGFNDGAVFFDLGLLHERSGQLDEAISAFRLSLIHDPDNVNSHRRLAEIFTSRGSFTEAADQYRELLRLREDNPLYHLSLGQVYGRMKDQKNAVREYEATVRLDPDNLEGHRELARLFMHEAQYSKAEHHYNEVLRLDNEDETSRNALITLYVKQKRYDDLTTFIKDWLEKAPNDPQRHYRLGIVYEIKKEYDLAVTEYKKSLALQPDNARMMFALGRTYMKSGRLSESREMLEAAKKADPTFAGPQLLLSSITYRPQSLKKSAHTKTSCAAKYKHTVHKTTSHAGKKHSVHKKIKHAGKKHTVSKSVTKK